MHKVEVRNSVLPAPTETGSGFLDLSSKEYEYDFTLIFPAEIVEKILKFFIAKDLASFQCVCRRWREFGNVNNLWLHFCMELGWLKYGVNNSILSAESLYPARTNISGNSPLFNLRVAEDTRLSPICKWKHIFLRLGHLKTNWRKGRYTVGPIMRGHTDKVNAFDCSGNTLISGSEDKVLRIWDLATCECRRKVGGHSDGITAVKILGNQVITGCGDGVIRVIDIATGKLVLTFIGHGNSVDHIQVMGSLIVSAGSDRTIRVWSLFHKELIYILRMHTDEIECLSVFGKHAVSGSWDKTLVLWDLDTGKCVHRMEGHSEVVSCVQFDSDKIVSGSADGSLIIWSCSTGETLHTLEGHTEEVYCLAYNDDVIASGSADSTIILWSIDGQFLHRMKEHMGVVRCIHINNERLVSGGDQSVVIVWDFRTGAKMVTLHRHPTKLHLMWVGDTKLITASPEKASTLTTLSFW